MLSINTAKNDETITHIRVKEGLKSVKVVHEHLQSKNPSQRSLNPYAENHRTDINT